MITIKKLEFYNNETFVKACQQLLESRDYEGGFDNNSHCVYRHRDDPNCRCIIGRAMYGRVPEDSAFWRSSVGIGIILNVEREGLFPEVKKAVPFLNRAIADDIQAAHDNMFANGINKDRHDIFWKKLLERAEAADAAYSQIRP